MILKIGIAEKDLVKSIDMLSIILASQMGLYIKTRKFHWNVYGDSFMELHKLFQTQYTSLEEMIDLVAERINKLGGKTIGTMKEFSKLSLIKEHPEKYPDQKEMLKELLSDYEIIINRFRNNIETSSNKSKDAGTIDFLTGMMQEHETTAWVLRRYLN